MANKYTIRYSGHSVEMSKPSSTVLVYKIPYRDLKLKNYGFEIPNQFIVYILFGKNSHGKDVVYVGKSKNGLTNRPTAHGDKFDNWYSCYILTQFKERTFFNDGTIQYLEDRLNRRFNQIGTYANTTENTTSGTANKWDEEDCDDYLEEAYDMLFILGLDMINGANEEDSQPVEVIDTEDIQPAEIRVPDGEYYMERKLKRNGNKPIKAKMRVEDGKFIVLPGSQIFGEEGPGLLDNIREIRNSDYVKDGILQREVVFEAPSAAGTLIVGAACNGWTSWRTKDGVPIDVYRNKR